MQLLASLGHLVEHIGRAADRIAREGPTTVAEGPQGLVVRILAAAKLPLESSLQLRMQKDVGSGHQIREIELSTRCDLQCAYCDLSCIHVIYTPASPGC